MENYYARLMANKKRRERYHLKKYGSLKHLEEKEMKLQKFMDDWSMNNEIEVNQIN